MAPVSEESDALVSEETRDVRPAKRRSTVGLIRDIVLSLTHIVEDSTELVGASVREELARFRADMARHALSLVAVVTGAALLTGGLAMYLARLTGSWPLTLLVFGGAYLVAGVVLQRIGSRQEDDWR